MKNETLKKIAWSFFLVLATAVVLAGSPLARPHKHDGYSRAEWQSSTTVHDDVNNCGDYDLTIRSQRPLRDEEQRSIPLTASALEVVAPENGGVSVVGWERNDYSVTACKAAIAFGGRSAAENLRRIQLEISGSRVTVTGPDSSLWVAHLIVRAPAGANIELSTHNGPVDLRRAQGKFRARTVNGPVAIKDISGELNVEAQNGPIDFRGGRGSLLLRAENGPINVELTGTRWESGELDASTHNGPVTLTVPENYQSGVRVETSEHAPVSCRASQCRQSARTWEHPSRIEFGGATLLVKLSTVNGPVTVRSR